MATTIATKYNLSGLSLSNPTGIVYDPRTHILYISNEGTNEIYMITNDSNVAEFNIIIDPSSNNNLNGPLGIALDSSSNLYIANNNNNNCPVAYIRQNNMWPSIYISTLSLVSASPVPDRDTKNTYFAYSVGLFFKISRMDKNNVLYETPPSVAGNGGPMTLGEDLSGNKFLALATSISNIVYLTFIPFTATNELPLGVFTPQSTGLSINSQFRVFDVVFANISATKKSLFISTYLGSVSSPQTTQFIRVDVLNAATPNSTTFTSTFITIPAIVGGSNRYLVSYLAVYPVFQSGQYTQSLYIGARDYPVIWDTSVNIVGNNYTPTNTITFPGIGPQQFNGCKGLSLDDNGYLYTIIAQRLSPTSSPNRLYRYYRGLRITLYPDIDIPMPNPSGVTYCSWDQSLFIFASNSPQLFKYYIGFPFTGINSVNTIGPYDDTGYIFDITAGANTYKFNFNIYTPYVVIDPSNIPINTPSEVSIHFVIPFVQPAPADSYKLLCDGQYISDIFCNNCTYNKTRFLSGTYPTGVVSSAYSNYLYVALQNNTISRIDTLGMVENSYIPTSAGLKGPTSLVLDASFDMFVLNAGSTYITKIILENNVLDIDNNYFTDIDTPICLTYDTYSKDYLYLLSGTAPNMKLTKILVSDPTQYEIIGLPFGTLYNSNGLTIGEFNPGSKYLYVSNTDQNKNYSIVQIPLPYTGLSLPTRLGSYLSFEPFTIANKNDGYLYVANKTSSSISKISVDSVLIQPNSEQPWVSNGISVPAGVCFDVFGNLYVANSGTGPRNSRISKIYIDYFFFTNVVIDSIPCEAQIYDLTTKSFVDVGYYPPPVDQTIFPIPIPFPINS
jgi:hypothetical protein